MNYDRIKYKIKKWLHWNFHIHDWKYNYRCDCPILEEYFEKKGKDWKVKWCHFCGVHSELTYKGW